jgi:hypothetical protein
MRAFGVRRELDKERDYSVHFPSRQIALIRLAATNLEIDAQKRIHPGTEQVGFDRSIGFFRKVIWKTDSSDQDNQLNSRREGVNDNRVKPEILDS